MSHLCDSTVAGPAAQTDSVLASKSEYPLSKAFLYLGIANGVAPGRGFSNS